MKRTVAVEKALAIAELIQRGVRKFRSMTTKDLPLLALLPWFKLGADLGEKKEIDWEALVPRVFEIIIFGSVANSTNEEVGDIDFIVLDNGCMSEFFTPKHKEDDWYQDLWENMRLMLSGWLNYTEEQIEEVLAGVETDLHVLPLKMLKSKNLRAEIAAKHSDPRFLQNAFSAMLRYEGGKLIPTDVAYFEKKYKTDLSDLMD